MLGLLFCLPKSPEEALKRLLKHTTNPMGRLQEVQNPRFPRCLHQHVIGSLPPRGGALCHCSIPCGAFWVSEWRQIGSGGLWRGTFRGLPAYLCLGKESCESTLVHGGAERHLDNLSSEHFPNPNGFLETTRTHALARSLARFLGAIARVANLGRPEDAESQSKSTTVTDFGSGQNQFFILVNWFRHPNCLNKPDCLN